MITNIYVLICAIVYIYIQFIQHDDRWSCALRLGGFYPPYIQERHQYWRFITCHFIHAEFLHFPMNAYALYQIGHVLEAWLGTIPYLYLIIISMLLSSLLSYSASQVSSRYYQTLTIGASGVVYGFFGAIIALGLILGGPFMSLLESSIYIIVINLIYTFVDRNISKTGHIGGLIGGILAIVMILALHIA